MLVRFQVPNKVHQGDRSPANMIFFPQGKIPLQKDLQPITQLVQSWEESTSAVHADSSFPSAEGGNIQTLKALEIPLPPLAIQQDAVKDIKAEQSLVNANRELIERFEKKIHAAAARVWNDG